MRQPSAGAARPIPSRTGTDARTSPFPDFIVIGAMKAGTTSLFEYLRAHPQVFMSPLKEVDFFVEELNWFRGVEWYRRQFRRATPHDLIGEASPSYSKYPEYEGVPERIAGLLPGVRLIYVVRDPIQRIRSHYEHRRMTGTEAAPIEEAVLADPTYVDVSRYAMQIERYLRCFPRERLLLVRSEDLRDDRVATLRRVHRFLGIEPDFVAPTVEREYYRTDERASYPSYVWWVRRNLKRAVPARQRWRLRRSVNRFFRIGRFGSADGLVPTDAGRGPGEPERRTAVVTDELRARLIDLLREDVARLHAYMPEGFDGWGIA